MPALVPAHTPAAYTQSFTVKMAMLLILPTDGVLYFSAGFSFIFVFYNLLRCGCGRFDLKTYNGPSSNGLSAV